MPATKQKTPTKKPFHKFFCGIPLYGSSPSEWVKHWIMFSSQLGKHHSRVMVVAMPYVDVAENFLIDNALMCECGHVFTNHRIKNYENCRGFIEKDGRPQRCPCKAWSAAEDFEWMLMAESDNKIPDGWLDLVATYNPKTQPIAGMLYFGKTADDQRPIPGYLRKDKQRRLEGMFERLTEEELHDMGIGRDADPKKRGLHSVDVVGMGATAIRREVFINWDRKKLPWFQTKHVPPSGFRGQDVSFCMEAKRQGHEIFVETRLVAGHLGGWESNEITYGNSMRWQREQKNGHV